MATLADLERASQPGSRIVVIDARSAGPYAAGHVPGALLMDPEDPEATLGAVLQACARAREVIVYCDGGSCPKSALAADLLRQAGVPPSGRILIYAGGYPGWVHRPRP